MDLMNLHGRNKKKAPALFCDMNRGLKLKIRGTMRGILPDSQIQSNPQIVPLSTPRRWNSDTELPPKQSCKAA